MPPSSKTPKFPFSPTPIYPRLPSPTISHSYHNNLTPICHRQIQTSPVPATTISRRSATGRSRPPPSSPTHRPRGSLRLPCSGHRKRGRNCECRMGRKNGMRSGAQHQISKRTELENHQIFRRIALVPIFSPHSVPQFRPLFLRPPQGRRKLPCGRPIDPRQSPRTPE